VTNTSPAAPVLVHATAIAIDGRAVLLRGPSGAGKSDLALRLIDAGARLIADDQVELRRAGERILVRAPAAIAGLIEIRGVGISRVEALAEAALAMFADLVPAAEIERLPEPRREHVLGLIIPSIALSPFEASAAAKLRVALRACAANSCPAVPAVCESARSRPAASTPPGRVVLVTGMSGAGRSTALKALEDIGYETFENLPILLMSALIESAAADAQAIAIGANLRTRGFAIENMLEALGAVVGHSGRELKVLFIDCDDELLQRRYTENRRLHPLAGDFSVIDGVRLERRLVSALRDRADLVIDTSNLSEADLRRLVSGHFALAATGLRLFVTSFAYRHGTPRYADLIFDVRFLHNPHYVPELRQLTGRDPAVAAHIERDPACAPFLNGLWGLLEPLLSRYEREGKTYLTIAIGGTGGRHRSVYVAERLAAQLEAAGLWVGLQHRDLVGSGPPVLISADPPTVAC
jgi:RNase adaptor protein for sRNA GlmZ degradation